MINEKKSAWTRYRHGTSKGGDSFVEWITSGARIVRAYKGEYDYSRSAEHWFLTLKEAKLFHEKLKKAISKIEKEMGR